MNNITMKLNADHLILSALQEDITSEDITTNSVMREYQLGEVELICKEDGIIAGLDVFKRVFELLDEKTEVAFKCKDGEQPTLAKLLIYYREAIQSFWIHVKRHLICVFLKNML